MSTDRELPPLPEPEWSGYKSKDDPDEYYAYTADQMRAYAALIAEDCAKLCEQMMDESYTEAELGGEMADPLDCAAAIRARYKAE